MASSKKTIRIDADALKTVDLKNMARFALGHKYVSHLLVNHGEHYRLLAHIASQIEAGSKVWDIGTFGGLSALALASNESIHVDTYDLVDHINFSPSIKDVPNVTHKIRNCIEDLGDIKDMPLIVLDIDPHDGVAEMNMYHRFIKAGFRGLLFCDDIHLNSNMNSFWSFIEHKKIDLSYCGHHSGSGIVVFDDTFIDVEVDDS